MTLWSDGNDDINIHVRVWETNWSYLIAWAMIGRWLENIRIVVCGLYWIWQWIAWGLHNSLEPNSCVLWQFEENRMNHSFISVQCEDWATTVTFVQIRRCSRWAIQFEWMKFYVLCLICICLISVIIPSPSHHIITITIMTTMNGAQFIVERVLKLKRVYYNIMRYSWSCSSSFRCTQPFDAVCVITNLQNEWEFRWNPVYVSECVRAHIDTRILGATHTHTHTKDNANNPLRLKYLCMRMRACLCVRKRERERKRDRER